MTEDEAKTKWCPMARIADINLGGSTNRPDNSVNCIASDCMMWRWGETKYEGFPSATVKHGHCGLAGKDE